MTITPTAALPGRPIAASGDTSSDSGSEQGGDFLAAVLEALSAGAMAPVAGSVPGALPGSPSEPAAGSASGSLPGPAQGGIGPAAGSAAGTVGQGGIGAAGPATEGGAAAATPAPVASPTAPSLATGMPAAGEPAPSVASAGQPAGPVPADGADGHANVTGGSGAATTDPTGNIRMPVGSAPAGEALPPDASGTAGNTGRAPASGVTPADPAGPTPRAGTVMSPIPIGSGVSAAEHANVTGETDVSIPDPTRDIRMSDDTPAAPAPAPHEPSMPDLPPAAVRIDASAAATPIGTDGADRARPAAVVTQVFPEVTRLLSRGDGVHRVTMTLNPESLGEVRVVMTMRAGVVRVHLSASDGDAKAALAHGSPELARLLETAGAGDARIVVRDLSQGPASTGGRPDGQPQLTTGDDRRHHAQEHAGTHGQHHATDGTTPRRGAGADLPRSIEPVGGTRTSGVDVTV